MNRHAPIERLLINGRQTSSHHLKTRLFRVGLKKPACELCGWCERAPDGRILVELDHINRFDNRLENLPHPLPQLPQLAAHSSWAEQEVEAVRGAGLEPARLKGRAF